MSVESELRPWGALALGGSGWSIRSVLDIDRVTAVVATALESGIRLFDTARAYTTTDEPAHNERLLGEALRDVDREGSAIVMSKGGHFRVDAVTWRVDASPEALRADCVASLRALRRERIDVYLLHKPDPYVPIEESVGALDGLRREGLVGSIGISNVDRALLERARAIAPIAVVENRFSAFDRHDADTVLACDEHAVPYLAYSSTGGGRRPGDALDRHAGAHAIARRLGVSPYAVWLAWLRRRSPAVTPLIGATQPTSVRGSSVIVDDLLSEEDWAVVDAEIEAVSPGSAPPPT